MYFSSFSHRFGTVSDSKNNYLTAFMSFKSSFFSLPKLNMSVNKVILIGCLGRHPEVRYQPSVKPEPVFP